MLKRLTQFFEKIAYAGLKPLGRKPAQSSSGAAAAPTEQTHGFAALVDWVDRKLNAAGPADPLYLSNRTFAQRMKVWMALGLPAVLVLAGVGLALAGVFSASTSISPPPGGLTDAQIAEKMLPDLKNDMKIQSQTDVDVEDVHVVDGIPPHLVGLARNKTDHVISKLEMSFDLTDPIGSRQGAVTTEIKNIAAKSTAPFQIPLETHRAAFALVREVHVQ